MKTLRPAANLLSAICAFAIVDGDTVRVGSETIRLRGYDAPETRYAQCAGERELGEAAAARLRELLCAPRAAVTVERGRPPRADKYGRTLAHIFVDGRNVAEIMIGAGLARPYDGRQRPDWCR